MLSCFFFFNDTATTEIYTLSLHDALPIYPAARLSFMLSDSGARVIVTEEALRSRLPDHAARVVSLDGRSEEHTSELQSRQYLVCRLLLEKKNINIPLHQSVSSSLLTLSYV